MEKVFRNGQMVAATMETGIISKCMATAYKHGRKSTLASAHTSMRDNTLEARDTGKEP